MQRRRFLTTSAGVAMGLLGGTSGLPRLFAGDSKPTVGKIRLGLVTYNWGKDWDVPALIRNCEATGFEGVELRSTHKHGVEITIDAKQREDVARQFADSKVELVGLGSACEYHSPDPAILQKNIDETKAFVKLCKDVGGTGVKVRPNGIASPRPFARQRIVFENIQLKCNSVLHLCPNGDRVPIFFGR